MFAELITQSGQSRVAWAKRLKISKSYLSDLLSGKKTPSLELAARIERETNGHVLAASWISHEEPVESRSEPGGIAEDAA